jgi:diguanylate cyclase (GGDEF)-like protein
MQWSIERKLSLAFGLVIGMMVGGTGAAYWAQVRALATQDAIARTYSELNDLEYLIAYVRAVTVAQRAYMISGDERFAAQIPPLRKDADVVIARVKAGIARDPEQSASFARFRAEVRSRRALVDRLNVARKDQGFEAAKALFKTGEDDRLLRAMIAESDAMKRVANSKLNALLAANHTLQQRIARTELIGVSLSVLLLLAVAFTLTRSINANVREITERKMLEQKLQDAYKAAEALAATDPLTGLANRRSFDQAMTREWRRGLRDHTPVSVLMIDADLFKSYNDEYGHPRGDDCLKQIAAASRNVVARAGDLLARFGGEEFCLILPNTDVDAALKVGGRICQAVRARKLPHVGNPNGIVTVSVGCAAMVPAFGLHAVNLIEAADAALYKAKRNGRNQACNGSLEADSQSENKPCPAPASVGFG